MMKPPRDPKYLSLIRSLPCAVCHTLRGVEAAHVGPHGMAQKASDYSVIPLCRRHHCEAPGGLDCLGPVAFMDRHGLSIYELAATLATKPTCHIEGRNFIAAINGCQYDLGALGHPRALLAAVRSAWRTHATEVLLAPRARRAVA